MDVLTWFWKQVVRFALRSFCSFDHFGSNRIRGQWEKSAKLSGFGHLVVSDHYAVHPCTCAFAKSPLSIQPLHGSIRSKQLFSSKVMDIFWPSRIYLPNHLGQDLLWIHVPGAEFILNSIFLYIMYMSIPIRMCKCTCTYLYTRTYMYSANVNVTVDVGDF